MKAKLTREMAVATLGGDKPEAATDAAFNRGFVTLRDVRQALRLGLNAGLNLAPSRGYIRVSLPRGATAKLPLVPPDNPNSVMCLLLVEPANGQPRSYFTASDAAHEMARRCGTDIEAAVRVLLGIERARKRCYELCEEGTRWL